MTREEAIKWLKTFKGNTGMPELSQAFDVAIKALEQEPIEIVLDKIRAEIDPLSDSMDEGTTVTIYSWYGMKRKVLNIIDKYKTESER